MNDVRGIPADLAAVQADDALLDAQSRDGGPLAPRPDVPSGLGDRRPSPEGSDARLAQLLTAWRREVHGEPVTRLVDVDTALAVLARRPGLLAPAWARGEYYRLIADVAAELERYAPLLCPPCRGTGRTFAWHHPGRTCARCRGDGLSDFARRSALTVGDLNMTWADAHNRLGDGPDGLGR